MKKITMKIKRERIQHGGRQMDVWCSIMQESLATFPLVFIIVIVIIIIVIIINNHRHCYHYDVFKQPLCQIFWFMGKISYSE